MKSRISTYIAAITLFATLVAPVWLASEDQQEQKTNHHHYKLIDMGTFGGNISAINFPADINDTAIGRRGMTVGFSETGVLRTAASNHLICGGDDGFGSNITHAFRWQNGIVDLGALAPAEENCSNAYQVNTKGDIAGFSEIGRVDPATGFNQSRAILWKHAKLHDLGSLGGNQNEALALNNHGQIVGFSQNTVADPTSFFDFLLNFPSPPPVNGTQTRAVLWQDGVTQDLGTLGTGTDAAALMINERGQIAGLSYTNTTPNPVTGLPQVDPFIWDHGKMIDIGAFGGAFGQPNYLNNRGQLVGGLSVPADPGACFFEDAPNCHPFLWENGNLVDLATMSIGGIPQTADGINDGGQIIGAADFSASGGSEFDAYLWTQGVVKDLGTLFDDCGSRAMAINSHSQVVGHAFSCPNFDFHHALLWQGDLIVDLNSLIPVNSSLELVVANDVNDRGEIAGMGVPAGVDPANVFAQGHAFLLIPCDENHPNVEGCDYSLVDATAPPDVTSPCVPHGLTILHNVRPGLPGEFQRPRLGQRLGPWNRALGAQTPTPATQPPESTEETKCLSGAITDERNANHLVESTSPFSPGRCIEYRGKLTGRCAMSLFVSPGCIVQPSTRCHQGAMAKKPGLRECCGRMACVKIPVDLDSACQ